MAATTLVRKVDVDDTGDNLSGTIHNNAWLQDLQQRIDNGFAAIETTRVNGAAALNASALTTGTVPVARLGAGVTTQIFPTTTGLVNNWSPGLSGDTLIFWTGNAALTITGFVAGQQGQRIIFMTAGSAGVTFKYQNSGSTANCRLTTFSAQDMTLAIPVQVNGSAEFIYNGGTWVMTGFLQGDPIAYTPILAFGGASVGMTYSVQQGMYSIINDRCFYSGRITLTSKGTSSGFATIFVPYPSYNHGMNWSPVWFPYYAGMTSMPGMMMGYQAPNSGLVNVTASTANGSGLINETLFTNGADIVFNGMTKI